MFLTKLLNEKFGDVFSKLCYTRSERHCDYIDCSIYVHFSVDSSSINEYKSRPTILHQQLSILSILKLKVVQGLFS